jgi:formyl-CoA transferase
VTNPPVSGRSALAGLRVLDLGHQYAAANAGAILADLGADVVSVEHPQGNAIRTMLPKKDGQSMWWKVSQRNKTQVTLNLSSPQGGELLLRVAPEFDVLIENFRPGTLEKWGIGPADLERAGANLTMVRVSGYGQSGPYRDRPGFGTIGEAMSGFAHMNGYPDGPPTFPSTTLADGVASIWAVVGALAGRLARLRDGAVRGVEVVDVALFEGLFRIVPTQIPTYQQTGVVQKRPGNYLGDHGVLRNVYGSRDGRWIAVSAVGPVAIRRVMVAARADALVAEIDAGAMDARETAAVEAFLGRCNAHLLAWSAAGDYAVLTTDLSAAGAVFSPIYSAADIVEDAHYRARDDLVTVQDPELGALTMQGVVPKFPEREHRVTHAGGERGRDNARFWGRHGLTPEAIARLRRDGVL